jgi:hypothetical protein
LTGRPQFNKVTGIVSEDAMGSDTKLTKTRRRMKAAKKAELRARKATKALVKLKAKGFNPKLSLQ